MPEAVAVFIAPPSPEALRARLTGRGTDTASRSRSAAHRPSESEARDEFAHVIVNDDLDTAADELERIVTGRISGRSGRPGPLT